MKVSEIMNKTVYTASPTTTVNELLAILEKRNIGGVPVVDFKGSLLGIVTDGDVLRFLSPRKGKIYVPGYTAFPEDETVEEVLSKKMNTPIIEIMVTKKIKTLSVHDDLEDAIRLISKHHIKKIPIINEEKKVVGIISRGDLIYHLSKKSAAIARGWGSIS
ncbi:CBS domain-containing protein [Niallia sp. Krafla_26]|uniref:CBS domain-containing protein n=1 Tax=Niallia sp. Krafla_26 TaxID=3064703 RepID=UPI003D17B577